MPTKYTTVKSGYEYYADSYSYNQSAYHAEREHNALVIAACLRSHGFTDNAIAGILGNMQYESSLNPGAYYGWADFSATSFGLVQWDPTSKYQNWADENGYLPYYDIEYQCERIDYEFVNGGQYYSTSLYPISRSEFKTSDKDPYTLLARSLGTMNGLQPFLATMKTQRKSYDSSGAGLLNLGMK